MDDIRTCVEDGGDVEIATTRPELLPACVGVTAHPEDERYKPLFGKQAVTPLWQETLSGSSARSPSPLEAWGAAACWRWRQTLLR